LLVPDGFYATYLQLEEGYCILEEVIRDTSSGKSEPRYIKTVLFLSANNNGPLGRIEAGEVHAYDTVKDILNECSSVLSKGIKGALLKEKGINLIPSQETIQKHKNTED
jgi:hypothetical protein